MSGKQRDEAVTTFMTAGSEERVLLMSLKAGGVGLTCEFSVD